MNETGKLLAVVLLASFAIERIVATVEFFLNREIPPEVRKRKIVLVAVAGAIAALVIAASGIRLLETLKFSKSPQSLDFVLTWLVLVGGADRIREFLGGAAESKEKKEKLPPIEFLIADRDVTVERLPRQG